MSTDCVLISCSDCDYNSKWKCNILRHVMRKHTAANVNSVTVPANVNPVNPVNTNNTLKEKSTLFKCESCNKIFQRNYNLTQHKCKGSISKLECKYCNYIFMNRSSKSRHIKLCKNKEHETKDTRV